MKCSVAGKLVCEMVGSQKESVFHFACLLSADPFLKQAVERPPPFAPFAADLDVIESSRLRVKIEDRGEEAASNPLIVCSYS